MKRYHAIVHGRVQGVSFRYYTHQTANEIGVTGWVRNRRDRTVEVMAEGTDEQLQKLLEFLHNGPPAARVDRVDLTELEATGEFTSFDVTYFAG